MILVADILDSELQKKYIRFGMRLLRKKLGKCASSGSIKEDMNNCGNPLFAMLYRDVFNMADKVEHGHQRNMIKELSEIFIWILNRDTAYRDEAIWMLNYILEHKEEYQKALKPYLKPPKKWYSNVWEKTMKQTEEGRKDGSISKWGKSHAEKIFTPSEQAKKFKNMK